MRRLLSLLFGLTLCLPAAAGPREVRVGLALPPEIVTSYGQPVAAAFLDVMGPLLVEAMGLIPSVETMSRGRMLHELKQGTLDVGFPVENAEERKEWIIHSSPLAIEQLVLVVPIDQGFEVTLDSLRSRILGGRLATSYPELDFRPDVRIERFDSLHTGLRLMNAKRIDALIVESQSLLPALLKQTNFGRTQVLPVAIGNADLAVAFGRHRFSERDIWRFNQALTRLMDKPAYEFMLNHYGLSMLDQRRPLMKLQ
ncbi:substrate-binding periplasmic protein [Lacibacterium aquatile]|uniref:Substrate-binding periplasmic protein n=1 Tax=Lacibacterium aquatile TaxID=1168082 RepID=A0ABW5DQP0_9PROT